MNRTTTNLPVCSRAILRRTRPNVKCVIAHQLPKYFLKLHQLYRTPFRLEEMTMSEIKDTQQHPKVEIAVKNFGSIVEANIDLRPLTVFVGPSNTGKTYFATLVYTLHDIFQEFAHLAKQKHPCGFNVPEAELETTEAAFKRSFDVASVSDLIRLPGSACGHLETSLKVSEAHRENAPFSFRVQGSERIGLGRNPLAELMLYSGQQIDSEQCYYLPAARSGILQSHRIIASSLMERAVRSNSSEMPTLSSVVVDFMKQLPLYEENKDSDSTILAAIAEALENDVLLGKIIVKPLLSGYPEFYYQPHGTKEEMRLSQTSSMVSELAPLVLFLRGLVNPCDTLIIEEPEAHLHPGAQADMAVVLARLVRAGVKVIITTHSDWLLEEIGNLTLEGLIREQANGPASWLLPEEVGAWHFQKDKPVKEIAFHPRRGFSPKDYQDVAEGLYNRSVNLQQRYEKQKN